MTSGGMLVPRSVVLRDHGFWTATSTSWKLEAVAT
jgi:hypothetical protein